MHLLFGVAGLGPPAFDGPDYLLGSGVIYVALFLLGLFVSSGSDATFPANSADDLLHLALGVVMVGIGYIYGKQQMGRTAAV